MEAVEVAGVSLRFDAVQAIDDVSLTVGSGEIVGLLGHNGAGKTTLLRVVNGLLPPDAGTVRVFGLDPVTEGQVVRRSTGVLTEYPALDEYLSPTENLATYAAINAIPYVASSQRIDQLMVELGLHEKRNEPSRDLSAGLKQRVALARALIHDPELLLLDEPTTNLDPVAARGVRELIHRVSRDDGKTVLLCTHNLAEAEELCDRVAIMRNGRILSLGTPRELRRSLGGAHTVRVTTDADQRHIVEEVLNGQASMVWRERDSVEIGNGPATPELITQLASRGVRIHRVEPVDPTLEELYLHLHGESDLAGKR